MVLPTRLHHTAGNCPDTSYASLTVEQSQDASFAYDPAFYCLSDPDPLPVILGNGGGTFAGLSASTVVAADGRLDLSNSGPGNHQIEYQTGGNCPDTSSFIVFINISPDAYFQYGQSGYCDGDTNPLPLANYSGGVFGGGSGLVIDSLTGEIDLTQSQAGNHTITYAFFGSCQTSFSQTILINPTDTTSRINYEDAFCKDSLPPLPQILGDSNGLFVASAGLVFQNPNTGSIDLLQSQAGGPYFLTFDLQNPCATDPADTLYIRTAPSINLNYPLQAVCLGDSPLIAGLNVVPSAASGAFSHQPGLVMDSLGTVDPSLSLPGTYPVVYQTQGLCVAEATTLLSVHPKPSNSNLQLYPDSAVCEGETVLAELSADDASRFFWMVNAVDKNWSLNSFRLDSAQDGDLIQGVIENAFGCRDTLTNILQMSPQPHTSVLFSHGNTSSDGRFELELITDVTATSFDWRLWRGDWVLDSGNALTSNQVAAVAVAGLEAGPDLLALRLEIAAQAGGCGLSPEYYELTLQNTPFFIPEVITPDASGQNDFWLISHDGTVNPSDYWLRLFNRSGALVHQMQPDNLGFDGKNLPDGVYWWVLQRGGQEVQKGGLTISRK